MASGKGTWTDLAWNVPKLDEHSFIVGLKRLCSAPPPPDNPPNPCPMGAPPSNGFGTSI